MGTLCLSCFCFWQVSALQFTKWERHAWKYVDEAGDEIHFRYGGYSSAGEPHANGKEVLLDGVNGHPFPVAPCVFWNEGSTFLKYDLPVEFFLHQSDLSCYLGGP